MDELLPTPTADQPGGTAAQHLARKARMPDGANRTSVTDLRMKIDTLRTSAFSQGSADWISRWKRRGIPASDRSSGTPTAPASSSDGGRLFPVGEISEGSALLPTPTAQAAKHTADDRGEGTLDDFNLWSVVGRSSSSEGSPASPPPPPADGREPPTIAGSGPSSPVSLASYDPERSWWRTFQASLLSTEDERFPRSWERWPTSGMTRRGRAYALPMSGRLIDGNGSSYLHTPTTGDTAPNYDHRASPGYERTKPVPNLAAQIEDELLPTPVADHSRGLAQPGTDYQSLPNAVQGLLPTPRSRLAGNDVPKMRDDGSWHGNLEEHLGRLLASDGDPTTPQSDDGNEP